ncbi:MAG: hypothetical protein PSN34_09315 [Urechidicola sp.]|nr:hypothetical protein [Urechidicola sp.]
MIKDNVIYKGNPKEDDFNKTNLETTNLSFLKDLFSIPYSYIRKIENQNGKNYIKISFGNDSEEELNIENENIKNEIFEFIRTDNPDLKYHSETPGILKYIKAQIFVLLSITGVFVWSLYLAIQIESGIEYELVGGGGPGITGIVLSIAYLGVVKIIIGYSIFLTTNIFILKRRLKSRSETKYLER